MWLPYAATLAVGLVVLAAGGETLVRSAARLARGLGVSSLAIGLTVVAFGTSAPEAAVTIFAAAAGAADLAVGNVVGSNIANVLLILGLAAVLRPLAVSRSLLSCDGPIMVLTAAALVLLAVLIGRVDRISGAAFVAGLVAYTAFTYRQARRDPAFLARRLEPMAAAAGPDGRTARNVVLALAGIGGLVLGARLIVTGASGLARLGGISEHVIGLTIVAVGTSLPELATTVAAARQAQPDIAIGNVVGSNIFNVLFVTGLAALVRPLTVPGAIVRCDGPAMLAVCLLFYPVAYSGRRVTRGEGAVLLGLYAAYLAWTAVRASA